MKAFILGQSQSEESLEQDNYLKKSKNNSRSCKIFPEKNIIKIKYEDEYLNKYINVNKSNNNSNRNFKNLYNNKNQKWQKDIKNRIYKNYYNKDIRKKYSDMNSEDSIENIKANKVKYMDWTENNSIQGNTISVKSNKISNGTNSIFNLKKNIKEVNINNIIKNPKTNQIGNEEELVDINYLEDSNRTKNSKILKNKNKKYSKNDKGVNNKYNKEILFEIKLTKEEYNMLIQQKSKNK